MDRVYPGSEDNFSFDQGGDHDLGLLNDVEPDFAQLLDNQVGQWPAPLQNVGAQNFDQPANLTPAFIDQESQPLFAVPGDDIPRYVQELDFAQYLEEPSKLTRFWYIVSRLTVS